MARLEFSDHAQLAEHVGRELGVSEWHVVDQSRVDRFAEVTGDDQWIHVDEARASAGPFGGTIAHGYLTLSMIPRLAREVYLVTGATQTVNYGLDRVRFLSPVRVPSRVRDRVTLTEVDETPKGLRCRFTHTIEIEGVEAPACIAETISLIQFSA